MNTEQERKDFEAFASKHGLSTAIESNLHRSHVVAWMWKAWQARAALQSQTIPASDWFDMFMELARAVVVANRLFAVSPTTTKQKVAADAAIALQEHARKHPALQSQDREDAEWMKCESRRPWVTNSLKQRANELREAEKRSRCAFNKDYMGEPARYFADACGEAAALFEAKLDAIDHARRIEGNE